MYAVMGTDTFLENLESQNADYLDAVRKISDNLSKNPWSGKPLKYSFFREKRYRESRIYYLVYDDLQLILLVATSGKKDQQDVIDTVLKDLAQFRLEAETISRRGA